MSTATLDVHEVPAGSRVNYLNAQYGVKSWLLTTDHKRIALLYLVSITLMFFVGGFFAVLMRLHLIEPQGALVQPETYNKLFTMHGVIMVFFFLVPSIPATLGNFLVPMMIGARDLAFPKLNLLSWYIYVIGAIFTLYAVISGGVDTGWTFYTPYSSSFSHTSGGSHSTGRFHYRLLFDSHRTEFCSDHSQNARAGPYLVPSTAFYLGHLCHQHHFYSWNSGYRYHPILAFALRRLLHIGIFDPAIGGDPHPLSASLLVLFSPRRLHHDFAGNGRDERAHHLFFTQANLWI